MSGFQVNYNFNPNYNMWNNLTSQNRGKYINKQDSCWNNYGYNYSPYNYNNNMMYSYNRYMRTLTISSLINSTFEMLSDFVKSLGDMFKPAKTETKTVTANNEMVTAYEKFEKDFVNGNKKGSFDVTGDAWRALVSKENKTEEEQKQIVTDYKKAFANFGEAYINKLDAEFGNGDGSLTEKEFIQTQISDVDSPDEDAVSAARNIFNHADINDDGKVDKKEMAAMFSLFDMARANSDNGSKEGQLNGKLYAPDIQAYSEILINPNSGDTANIYKAIDEKLKSRYNNLFGDKQ